MPKSNMIYCILSYMYICNGIITASTFSLDNFENSGSEIIISGVTVTYELEVIGTANILAAPHESSSNIWQNQSKSDDNNGNMLNDYAIMSLKFSKAVTLQAMTWTGFDQDPGEVNIFRDALGGWAQGVEGNLFFPNISSSTSKVITDLSHSFGTPPSGPAVYPRGLFLAALADSDSGGNAIYTFGQPLTAVHYIFWNDMDGFEPSITSAHIIGAPKEVQFTVVPEADVFKYTLCLLILFASCNKFKAILFGNKVKK